ncbi:MAG: EAL domain-containing protein [Terriglobia bacterium]|jgi:diguanylate cyclase (GGDEF)-like protein/PAS domain S-box-containing protein
MSNPEKLERRSVILVVDDDPTSRALIRESLGRFGFEVIEAEDGSKALQRFAESAPDLVVMDVETPNPDGFEACAALRRLPNGQATPVLMVNGRDDVESVNRAFEAGAIDFLPRPVNWALFGHRVRYMLRASQTYRALKAGEARLAKAQRLARLGHWDWEVGEDRWSFSDEVCRIIGFSREEQPANREVMLKVIHPEDRDHVLRLFQAALRGEEKYEIEYQLVLPDGTTRVVAEQAEVSFDGRGQPKHVEGTLQDLTERRQVEARIQYLAYYDGLTGLPNRLMMSEHLAQALRQVRRSKRPLALLFLDLDNFKSINDALGHSLGDELLRQVADRLSQCVRSSDLVSRPGAQSTNPPVFRFGGDEFAILLFSLQQEQDALLVVRRIMSALAAPFVIEGHELFATASIGIALSPSDGDDLRTLLRNADAAMYQAKQKGRNTFEFYTKSLTRICVERMKIEAKLRRAIEQDELKLCFQPKLETQSGRLAGVEALLRWNAVGLGSVPPEKFIPLAEETGLIVPIGEWVLREACRQIQAWETVGLPLVPVAVNVSARQFQRSDLSKSVSDLLEETGLRPQSLELELTESAIMADIPRAKAMFQKLSELGVRLSIDDFGTGFSSLSLLRWFRVDTLKIDRSFVQDLPQDEDDSAITLGIIAMAHSLGIRVVAEGIETESQFAFLKEHGCDEVQGSLLGLPVTGSEFAQSLDDAGPALQFPLPVQRRVH